MNVRIVMWIFWGISAQNKTSSTSMISRIWVILRCGSEVVLFLMVYLLLFSDIEFNSQLCRLTQIIRVCAMLLLLKKAIAGLERYFHFAEFTTILWLYNPKQQSNTLYCLQVLLGTDSHTCTAGAFGQFATGIGNTDAGFVLGTGKLLLKVCRCFRFVFISTFPITYTYHWPKDVMQMV